MIIRYSAEELHGLCDEMAGRDTRLAAIIGEYGYPPVWIRENSFDTLVLTILEQQVSLASAYAAFTKLRERLQSILPQTILTLTDEELRACYLSRQKTVYVRGLANAILSGEVLLEAFEHQPDEEVRSSLKKLKGIGDWTVDIYLLHALRRADVFPVGDLALVNGVKMIWELKELSREELVGMGEAWRPYRSVATMMVWHCYIRKRGIRLEH